jgi:hypothetical protein
VPLQVSKQSLDVAVGGHNRFGGELRNLCRNSFWKRFCNILVPVRTDCPVASKSGNTWYGQVGYPAVMIESQFRPRNQWALESRFP